MREGIKFEIKDDEVIRYTQMPPFEFGDHVYKMDVVMDKETFIECFNRWVCQPNTLNIQAPEQDWVKMNNRITDVDLKGE